MDMPFIAVTCYCLFQKIEDSFLPLLNCFFAVKRNIYMFIVYISMCF